MNLIAGTFIYLFIIGIVPSVCIVVMGVNNVKRNIACSAVAVSCQFRCSRNSLDMGGGSGTVTLAVASNYRNVIGDIFLKIGDGVAAASGEGNSSFSCGIPFVGICVVRILNCDGYFTIAAT